MDIQRRTIGFHPCVSKTVGGQARPTQVVIRAPDGEYEAHQFDDQQLLDFITWGTPTGFRLATLKDVRVPRPPHHNRWEESDEATYRAATKKEQAKLFKLIYAKRGRDAR